MVKNGWRRDAAVFIVLVAIVMLATVIFIVFAEV